MKSEILISILTMILFSSCSETQEYTNIPIFQLAKCEIPISIDNRLLCNPENEILREKAIVTQLGRDKSKDTIGYQITELRGNKGECTIKSYSIDGQVLYHVEYLPSSNYSIDTFNQGSDQEIIEKSFKGQIDFIKKWYVTGNLKSEYEYKNGILNGIEIQYYENGKKKEIGNNDQVNKKQASYKSGEWIFYDESENIIKRVNYIKDKPIGKYTEYYPSGKIKVDGMYGYGKGICEISILDPKTYETSIEYVECENASIKSDEWKHYKESGELISKEQFKITESNTN